MKPTKNAVYSNIRTRGEDLSLPAYHIMLQFEKDPIIFRTINPVYRCVREKIKTKAFK